MTDFRANITKRRMKQKNREGKVFEYDRYLLHYNDPATGKRVQKRFNTRKEAEAAQNNFIKNADAMRRRKGSKTPTLGEAVDYWLESKKQTIQKKTHHAYSPRPTSLFAFRIACAFHRALHSGRPEGSEDESLYRSGASGRVRRHGQRYGRHRPWGLL